MIALAVLPGLILFFAVWKLDTVEKEPPALLLKLFISGVLVMVIDILLRTLGLKIMEGSYNGTSILLYTFIDAFILTALMEEGGRLIVLKLLTWKNKEFNYTFDAIVYAVTVSVGFLTAENIFYLIRYGSDLNPVKLILPIIAQMIISVFMGYFYGLAKLAECRKDASAKKMHMWEAILIPTSLHGLYELCLASGETVFIVLFIIYTLVMTVMAVLFFFRVQKNDTEISWNYETYEDGEPFEKDVTALLHKRDNDEGAAANGDKAGADAEEKKGGM